MCAIRTGDARPERAGTGSPDREASRGTRTLLLGLGNDLLRDDGVGLRAARRIAERVGDSVDHVEACIANLDLLSVIEGYRRVVVLDAFLAPGEPPGSTVHGGPEDLPAGFGYRSLHTMPFGEMLALGRKLGLRMPVEMSIYGLCVEDPRTFGEQFSPVVERTWRPWADRVACLEFGVPDEPRAAVATA